MARPLQTPASRVSKLRKKHSTMRPNLRGRVSGGLDDERNESDMKRRTKVEQRWPGPERRHKIKEIQDHCCHDRAVYNNDPIIDADTGISPSRPNHATQDMP